REEQVDLMHILFQRGVAALVPGDVKRSADAFVRIQRDLRRPQFALPMSALPEGVLVHVAQRLVSVSRFRQHRLRQRLAAQSGVRENQDDYSDYEPGNLEKQPEILPTLQLWVIKDGIGHAGRTKSIVSRWGSSVKQMLSAAEPVAIGPGAQPEYRGQINGVVRSAHNPAVLSTIRR